MAPNDNAHSGEMEFVTFQAGGQSYSLDIARVREIRRWGPVTPIPHAPAGMLGVMNLRGSVIPVYDLAARLGLPPTEEDARNVIVVAMHAGQTIGLLVESVARIISVARDMIQQTSKLHLDGASLGVTGLITLEEGMTRVVDLSGVVQSRTTVAA